jgi:transposase
VELMSEIFEKYPTIKQAYDLVQDLKRWYHKSRCQIFKEEIKYDLHKWYIKVLSTGIKDFNPLIRTLRKHEYEILNYFSTNAQSNARAERLNGKIKRFVAANYGLNDKNFVLWRIANYFS